MAEFEAITSQEALDAVLKDRLSRQNEKHAKEIADKYGDYDDLKEKVSSYEKQISELNASIKANSEKAASYEKEIADRDSKISAYELRSVKTRIALEVGIPYELADRLSGSDEKEIRADAEKLVSVVGKAQQKTAPLKDASVVNAEDGVTAAFRKLNPNIKI